jgi:hypothetical protein
LRETTAFSTVKSVPEVAVFHDNRQVLCTTGLPGAPESGKTGKSGDLSGPDEHRGIYVPGRVSAPVSGTARYRLTARDANPFKEVYRFYIKTTMLDISFYAGPEREETIRAIPDGRVKYP